ncbi:hypothetical protein SADO_08852 [Salinisphaera dokdonensis CL-ES53]|uniref:DUF1795 domain-containing protein n=1 Tax=Salinisphaera dokdonensis CL-ES53 TaxID=1304272 RepID=A0ABV2B0F7_9GAMM
MGFLVLSGASCTSHGAQDRPAVESQAAFEHYRNTRYDYQLDYPAGFEAEPVAGNGDGRVIRSDQATLRVFGVQLEGRSLRALAASEIADPTAASEIQNSEGSVVLVQEQARAMRTVKTIALSDDRAAVLVIDGSMAQPDSRERVLASFKPVSRQAADRSETDADRRYRNPELGFSIEKPKGARVSRDGADSVSFAVLGPKNEAASEISDGFTLTVIRDPQAEAATLAEYAEATRPDGAPSAERLRVGGQETLRYESQSEMGGSVTHWLFMPDRGGHYHVSATVSGPTRDYPAQIEAMLSSLRFSPD